MIDNRLYGNYIFRKVDGVWERKRPGEKRWERLRVEDETVTRRTLRNIGANGKKYYTDVEDVKKIWIWEPISSR